MLPAIDPHTYMIYNYHIIEPPTAHEAFVKKSIGMPFGKITMDYG